MLDGVAVRAVALDRPWSVAPPSWSKHRRKRQLCAASASPLLRRLPPPAPQAPAPQAPAPQAPAPQAPAPQAPAPQVLWRALVETVERARGALGKAVARSRQPASTTRCATGSWSPTRARARQATHADGSADPAAHRHLRVPTPLPIAIERHSGCHRREILRRDVEPASKLTCSLLYNRRPDALSCSRP